MAAAVLFAISPLGAGGFFATGIATGLRSISELEGTESRAGARIAQITRRDTEQDGANMLHQGLANRRLQPLGHSSVAADMPEEGASRKQQIPDRPIPTLFDFVGASDFGFR
jgi:hypothetical protein